MTRAKFLVVILLAGLTLLGVAACEKSPTSPDDPPSSQLPPNPNPPVPAPPAKLYFRALDDDRQLNTWIQDLVFKPPVNSTVIGFQTNGYSSLNCAMNMCPEFTGNICAEVPAGSGIGQVGIDGQFFFSENPKDFKWYMGGDGAVSAKGEGQTVCAPFNYTNGATWLSPFPYGEPRYWEIKTTEGVFGPGPNGYQVLLAMIPAYLSVPTGYYNPCVYQSPCIPQK